MCSHFVLCFCIFCLVGSTISHSGESGLSGVVEVHASIRASLSQENISGMNSEDKNAYAPFPYCT